MKDIYWMIIANGSCMKLFKFPHDDYTLQHPDVVLHPESTLKQQDFDTDRSSKSHTFGNDSEMTSTKKLEEKKFAKEISHFLKKGHDNKEFIRLYLAASPNFLGLLRGELPKEIQECIAEETNKDLTKISSSEIWSHFPSHQ
ncbi:MAG: host attachment protein [Simkaniaceae bacterium]|nr:host attachment protein [Simkaniaceae bacterium]MCF7852683.1 host attachment protein [Simkaniaceae bacterium]